MNILPKSVSRLFWGDDLKDLDWNRHKKYITKTILEKGDKPAIKWLFKKTDRNYIKSIVHEKKIDPKSANFWKIYLS